MNAWRRTSAQDPRRRLTRPHVRTVVVQYVRTFARPSSTPGAPQGSRARGPKSTSMSVDRARSTVIELDHVGNPSSIEFIEIHRARSTVIEVDSILDRPSSSSIMSEHLSSIEVIEVHRARSTVIEVDSNLDQAIRKLLHFVVLPNNSLRELNFREGVLPKHSPNTPSAPFPGERSMW